MKIGYYAPLPPARTGVADYAAALLQALRQFGTVEVDASHAGVNLYQIGNNQLHRSIYERAVAEPGIVVLHDAVLQHFYLGSLAEQQYVDEFVHNYGPWYSALARSLWRNRARSGTDPMYFRFPMLKRIVENSVAVIVHNPAAAAVAVSHAPGARVHEIPHLFVRPELPARYEVARLRASLGVPASTLLAGVFGHLRESKRITAVLRAFERARAHSGMVLLLAGDFASSDLERSVDAHPSREGILRIGHLPEREFWMYASAVDVCVNLRYPAAGETSGIAVRLMGIGKPAVLTGSPENARYPVDACIRIPADASEEETLFHVLLWLSSFRRDALEIGFRAEEHIRQEHDITHVAARYWNVLQNAGMPALV